MRLVLPLLAALLCIAAPGALAITAGMFLPAFAFSLLFYERPGAVVENERLHLLLAGVAAAVVGLIAVMFIDLARAAAAATRSRAATAAIFAGALAVLYRWRSKLAPPVASALG